MISLASLRRSAPGSRVGDRRRIRLLTIVCLLSSSGRLSHVIGPMLVRALDLAQSLALAMEARAFGARHSRTSITEIHLSRVDWYIMVGCALLIAAAIVLRILGIGVLIRGYL